MEPGATRRVPMAQGWILDFGFWILDFVPWHPWQQRDAVRWGGIVGWDGCVRVRELIKPSLVPLGRGAGALHGVRSKRQRSTSSRWRVGGTRSATLLVCSAVSRWQCQCHRWQVGPCRCMDGGVVVEMFCWRRGRELEEYDCAQTSTESRRITGGQLYESGRRLLVPESQIQRGQLKWAGPACLLVRFQSVHGPPNLTHCTHHPNHPKQHPTIRGPRHLFFFFWCLFSVQLLMSSSVTAVFTCSRHISSKFHLPSLPVRRHKATAAHTHMHLRDTHTLSLSSSLSLSLSPTLLGDPQLAVPPSSARSVQYHPPPRAACSSTYIVGPAARVPRKAASAEDSYPPLLA